MSVEPRARSNGHLTVEKGRPGGARPSALRARPGRAARLLAAGLGWVPSRRDGERRARPQGARLAVALVALASSTLCLLLVQPARGDSLAGIDSADNGSVLRDPSGLASSAIPGYPDVLGEYIHIPGAASAGTPRQLATAAFLRVRSALDGVRPREADAVIVAMPGFSSVPSHWLFLAAQVVHKGNLRECGDGRRSRGCRVEVWIVERRGSNLEDTFGLWFARLFRSPEFALDYYFGASIIGTDPELPGRFPSTPPQLLTGRPDASFRPLRQGDVPFASEWGFETYAGDVDRMIDLIRERRGGRNIFLAGHSQGGGFVSAYAGRMRPDGRRGNDLLAGLIFLDGGPSAGTSLAPSAEQLQGYFAGVNAFRTGASPVFTDGAGPLPNYNGPGPGARTALSGIFLQLLGPNAESIFPPRQTHSLPTSPAGDGFLRHLRVNNLAAAGLGFDTDPLPGRGLQNGTIAFLGEGLGQLDFSPVPGTEGLCDPASPPGRCMPDVRQIDPARVYGWREGTGVGEVGRALLFGQSVGYAPSRTNVRPVVHRFAVSGTRAIFAGYMNAANWYPSNRWDSDMAFLGAFRTVNIQEQGVRIDIDKGVVDRPVYVARQATTSVNPFPLVADFSEVNRAGVTQSAAAAALSPFDPAIDAALYRHTDFVSADDSTPSATPGEPGSSAVSNTLVDWVLARRAGTAEVPDPRELGVARTF